MGSKIAMASFGRRPARGGIGVVSSSSSKVTPKGRSALEKLREEEAERERFEKEFQVRSAEEGQRETSLKEREAAERKEHEEMLKARKGKANPTVFLDIEVRGPERSGRPGRVEASGRLEIELFADVVPRTAENFRCLCTGERGRDLHYKGATFHRIVPGFMAQGGDITKGDGTGGMSIYGPRFMDESFARLHSRCNLLSMANSGPNTNNSQFFVLFRQSQHLDRKHVVFGEITRESGGVMKRLEGVGSESGDVQGSVVITDCGELCSAEDEIESRERFRQASRSRTRSASRRRKQRKCYI